MNKRNTLTILALTVPNSLAQDSVADFQRRVEAALASPGCNRECLSLSLNHFPNARAVDKCGCAVASGTDGGSYFSKHASMKFFGRDDVQAHVDPIVSHYKNMLMQFEKEVLLSSEDSADTPQ